MKKGVVLCLLLLLVKGHCLFSALPKEIVVGYHEDFPPYFKEIDGEEGKLVGIFPEMIDAAAAKLGIQVKYNRYPWKRLLRVAEAGKVDAVFPLFKTRARMRYLIYPDIGIAVGVSVLFAYKNSNIEYKGDLNNLRAYSIGFIGGYEYGEEFASAKNLQKDECPTDESLIKKFISRRFQVGAGSDEVVKFYAQKHGVWDQIKFLDPPLLSKVLFIGFSKKKNGEELARKFSGAIAELGKDGTHQRILEKYHRGDDITFFKEIVIGADWEDYPPYSYWENDQIQGICPKIINKVAESIGVKVCYRGTRWGEFPKKIKQGELDAIMPLFRTGEREQFLYFPFNGLVAEKNYFITWKNSGIRYSGDLHDLKGIPIGVVENYSYGETFDKIDGLKKKYFSNVKAQVESVKNKQVKIAVGEYRVVQHYIKNSNISDLIVFLQSPLPREFLYLAFSRPKGKGYEKLAGSFSNGIRELMRTGEYQKILKDNGIKKRRVLLAANNWQPFYGDNLPGYGPIAEIITESFRRADYEVKIDFMPWSNLLENVNKGKYDAAFAPVAGIKPVDMYYLSDPVGWTSPVIFLKRADADIIYTGFQDLREQGYRIGVVRDFLYEPGFDNTQGLQRIVADSAETNIQNLLGRRLDLVIIDKAHALHLLDKMSESERGKLEFIDIYPDKKEIDTRQELRLFISKESIDAEQLIIDFNFGLKKIKAEGIGDRILQKLKEKGVEQ